MARLRAEAGESWQENYKTLTNCLQGGEVLLSGVTGNQLALKHWRHDKTEGVGISRQHHLKIGKSATLCELASHPGELFAIRDTLPAGTAHHLSPVHAKVAEAGAGS